MTEERSADLGEYLFFIETAVRRTLMEFRQDIDAELKVLERVENPIQDNAATQALRPVREALEKRIRRLHNLQKGSLELIASMSSTEGIEKEKLEDVRKSAQLLTNSNAVVDAYEQGQKDMQERCYNVTNWIGTKDSRNCISELKLMYYGEPVPDTEKDTEGWV